MMVTMIISLYTSRIVLQVLGVDDYGIYQAVGGIVGFLSFINNALSAGTSRFITYGLGVGDLNKLKSIFSTTFTGHVILAFIIVIIAETVGLWFLHNKMVIPSDRLNAAEWVYHLSIIAAFFTLTQVPFNACIIAHEKMTVYAYVSIIDAACRLLIVYLLLIGQIDKLILYAILHVVLQLSFLLFYRFYSIHHFEEVQFHLNIEKKVFREIIGFSGWNFFSQVSIAINNQGILLLLNMFFSPSIVTARSISIQVNMAVNQFLTNFQTAATPQIVKKYAASDYVGSKRLLLNTAKYSYYLMLLLVFPICMSANELLTLWLGVVPEYTAIFLQLILVQSLFQVFDTSLYGALNAMGRLKENAIISPLAGYICFTIVYVLFRNGASPVALSWSMLVTCAIVGLIVKPLLIIHIANYTWWDIFSLLIPCVKVTLFSLPLPLGLTYYLKQSECSIYVQFVIVVITCMLSVVCSSWFIGIPSELRRKIIEVLKKRIK